MNVEEIIEPAAKARPGYDLAFFKDAGHPIVLLTVKALILARKPLGPIEEGLLSAVDAAVDTPEGLIEFLGLPPAVITAVLARLNGAEMISYTQSSGDIKALIRLTAKGRAALTAATTVTPQEKTFKVPLDALTRRILLVHPNQLFKPRDMRVQGLFEVPAGPTRQIEVEDIPLQDFDRVLARERRSGNEPPGELLSIRKIERRELTFLPCVLLFYAGHGKRTDVAVAFHLEDGPSLDHEKRFREIGGPELIGAKKIAAGAASERKALESALSEISTPISPGSGETERPAKSSEKVSAVDAEDLGALETLQSIRCHEHPSWLRKALVSSKKRLLIISPWIRDAIIDERFIGSLHLLLKAGVLVYIGYGLAEGNAKNKANKLPITPQAEKDLTQVQKQYPKTFRFVFVGNTHRKTLVSDDQFAIVTSFNWMSFKGDPNEKPRDEHGVVIRKKVYVDRIFQQSLSLLDKGYAGADRSAAGKATSERRTT